MKNDMCVRTLGALAKKSGAKHNPPLTKSAPLSCAGCERPVPALSAGPPASGIPYNNQLQKRLERLPVVRLPALCQMFRLALREAGMCEHQPGPESLPGQVEPRDR